MLTRKGNACSRQINTPFILAPPRAARAFYASVSGARRLPAPNDQFYAFPCLNPPAVQFEFGGASASSSSSSGGGGSGGGGGDSSDGSDGGMPSSSSSASVSTRFTVLKAGDVRKHVVGGRFSLGRIRPGSGYCVGAVVETRMGAQEHSAADAADDSIKNSNAQRTKMAKRKDWRGATTTTTTTTSQRRLSMGGEAAGNGLDDVWILGEPFFRSVALVFDVSSYSSSFFLLLFIIIERHLSPPPDPLGPKKRTSRPPAQTERLTSTSYAG